MKIELIKFNKKHLPLSRIWMNEKEICRLFGRVYKYLSESEQNKWFEKVKKDKTQLIFAIQVDGVYIGNVGLKNISTLDQKAEYYILIGNKDYWKKGIGFFATKDFLKYVINNFILHKIYLHVDQKNVPAIKLYKKLEFKKEGVLKDEIIREGKYVTMIRMAYFFE